MPVLHVNKNPSRRDLAVFGALLPAFFALVGWGVLRHHWPHSLAVALWVFGGVLTLAFWALPGAARRAIFLGFSYATAPIGLAVVFVVMVVVFFGVLTPVGIVMRTFGYDPMGRRFDPAAGSYWVKRSTQRRMTDYFRQF